MSRTPGTRRFLLHPSRARLTRWLATGEPPELHAHLDRCSRCATRLEELAQPVPALRDALVATLETPPDLGPRLGRRLDAALRERAQLALLGELLGIPWQTARLLTQEDEE